MIYARCTDCGDEQPVGDRPAHAPTEETTCTTKCPSCKSTSYESIADGDGISKSEDERITDAIRDVYGVGQKNLDNILDTYSTYVEIERADVEDLTAIEGIGEKTAEGIVAAT
jgi:ERCC4-type nuclease